MKTYQDILQTYGIEIQEKDKYNCVCPKCSSTRKKSTQKCLQVFIHPTYVVWQCHHSTCEWSTRQFESCIIQTNIKQEIVETKAWDDFGFWPEKLKEHYNEAIKYPYYTKEGTLYFYVIRIDNPTFIDLDKWVRPISQLESGLYSLIKPSNWNTPYNIIEYDNKRPTLIVEGEKAVEYAKTLTDKLNILTWPGGAGNVKAIDWSFLKDQTVILWPDADKDGVQAMDYIKDSCLSSKIYIIPTDKFEKGQDIADFSKEQVQEILKTRQLYTKPLIHNSFTLEEFIEEASDVRDPLLTYFDNIDQSIKFPTHGIVIISGRSGHGKSTLMTNLVYNLLQNSDRKVIFWSLELTASQVFSKLINIYETKNSNLLEMLPITSCLNTTGYEKMAECVTKNKLAISSNRCSLKDIMQDLTNGDFTDTIVIIDYVQILKTDYKSQQSRYKEIQDQVYELKDFASKRNILFIVGSQLTPAGDTPDADKSRESEDINNVADLHIKIWNKPVAKETGAYKIIFTKDGEEQIKEYYKHIKGDLVLSVKKNRWGPNTAKCGFILKNGVMLQEVK